MLNQVETPHPKYWMPIQWILAIFKKAKNDKQLDDGGLGKLMDVKIITAVIQKFLLANQRE